MTACSGISAAVLEPHRKLADPAGDLERARLAHAGEIDVPPASPARARPGLRDDLSAGLAALCREPDVLLVIATFVLALAAANQKQGACARRGGDDAADGRPGGAGQVLVHRG